ncbi:MAG: glycosyl hydrolase family 28 protein [Acidobacteriota bacterium]|nr:glycosyl hydrolase family 28 protein [Acidobacteriota bacterium]
MTVSFTTVLLGASLFISSFNFLNAQDTRKVAEPTLPPPCTTLQSRIGRAGLSIAFDDESKLDTTRIQAALDQCTPGHAVILRKSSGRLDAFVSGPLDLRSGVALIVDAGTYLFASRNPRDYDRSPGVCGTIDEHGHGCRALINGENVPDSGVMGDGVIDGRGGETMLGGKFSWWNLADMARQAGAQNNPRLIVLKHCNNFVLYRITLMNSPNFHVGYDNGDGFTVWGVKIWCPERARNTDGIDPGNSSNVTIANSYFHTGDDQIAIKAQAGKATTHMSIVHNHFYSGHGMSIGSQTEGGASAIRVSDLSIDGSDNGLRIKSNRTRGGLVRDVVYDDVCIRNTANPVFMDTNYLAHTSKGTDHLPMFRDIVVRNVRVQGGGKVTLEALDETHRLSIQFDNLVFDNPGGIKIAAKHAEVKVGPGPFDLTVQGPDVSVAGTVGRGIPNACTGKFVEFPAP